MRKFALPVIVLAALAVVSFVSESAEAAVRRVYVAGVRPRVHVVTPVRRFYRPLVVVPQSTGQVIYSPWNYNSAIIVRPHVHVVPTARPIGVWAPVVW